MPQYTFRAIGLAHSCYGQKFGVPRQAGLSKHARGKIEIYPPYNRADAFTELKYCSHIWLQFVFHQNRRTNWKPRVKAPRLGGNKTAGVFATRSPVRPNPIGLSAVKLERIDAHQQGLFLHVSGIDLVDGTPILDIKPYVPYCDSLAQARNEFAHQPPPVVPVVFTETAKHKIILEQKTNKELNDFFPLIEETLQQNPSPQYHTFKSDKIYTTRLYHYDIKWHFLPHEKAQIEVLDLEILEMD